MTGDSKGITMKKIKEEALNAISTLPDDAEINDIMYRLFVIDQIDKGLNDIEKGNVISVEELEKEIEKW